MGEKREMKRLPISEVAPGMITAQDIYSRTDQLILNRDTVLGADSIAKLMFYAIGSIWVYIGNERGAEAENYSDVLRASEDFQCFMNCYNEVVAKIKDGFQKIALGEAKLDEEQLMEDIQSLIGNSRSNVHIFNMLHCVRNHDDSVFMHSINVALICNVFADWLHLSQEDKQIVTMCGLLHDTGKLLVPPRILNNPSKLSDEDYEVVKLHAQSGYELLKGLDISEHVKNAARDHHERYDGSGYPAGKSGTEIDMFTSIVAIADVYDAMTSKRIYRGALCPFDVIKVFEEDGLHQFNPQFLLPVLSKMAETYIHHNVRLSDGRRGEVIMINPYSLSCPVVRVENSFVDLSKKREIMIHAVL